VGCAVVYAAERYAQVRFLTWAGYALTTYSLWWAAQVWVPSDSFWMLLPMGTLAYGIFLFKRGGATAEWFGLACLVGKCVTLAGAHSFEAVFLSILAAQTVYAGLGRWSGKEKLFQNFFELVSIPVPIILVVSDFGLSLGVMLVGGSFAVGSLALARGWESGLKPAHFIASGFVWGVLLVQGAYPHPLLSLTLTALASAIFMKLSKESVSLGLLALATLGLAFAPFGYWIQGPALLALAVTIGAATFIYAFSSSATTKERIEGLGGLLLFRWSLSLAVSPLSTLFWMMLAALLLRHSKEQRNWNLLGQGSFDVARLLLFAAFLKSVVWDANFVTTVSSFHFPVSFAVAASFLVMAHFQTEKSEERNGLVVAGLLVFCFQATFLLHRHWGYHDLFQPLMSGFWSFTAFGIIALGVMFQVKVYRLFGLATMVASAAKVLLVDIHVLDAYSQTNTFLILGSLLVSTSLLYQKQRGRLTGEPGPVQKTSVYEFG
jgi:hypothetical protein